jgi:hypothetical protein
MKIQFNDTFKLGKPEKTYLWLVDIVGYSKIKNLNAQEILIKNIFNCVYASVNEVAKIIRSNQEQARELTSDDATVIWTGDGAIVAMKYPFGVDTPLLLTSYFNYFWRNEENWTNFNFDGKSKFTQRNAEIPKVHIAAHSGDCRWLQTPTLRSPLFEISNCFGVDINLLARIATFSSENGEFIISEDYFRELKKVRGNYILKLDDSKEQKITFSDKKINEVSGKGNVKFKYREFNFL